MSEDPNKQIKNVISYFNKIARDYDKLEVNKEISYDELYDYITSRIEWYYIRKYLPKSGVVLDAAGGTGRLAIPIAQRGLKVVLVDISEGMLRVAKEKVKKNNLEDRIIIKQGDIHYLDFPDN
ncbi:MAG: class I SAM-dependent methyltransferase [Candidatus Njordarchaeales archaeon]